MWQRGVSQCDFLSLFGVHNLFKMALENFLSSFHLICILVQASHAGAPWTTPNLMTSSSFSGSWGKLLIFTSHVKSGWQGSVLTRHERLYKLQAGASHSESPARPRSHLWPGGNPTQRLRPPLLTRRQGYQGLGAGEGGSESQLCLMWTKFKC